jgi:PIN domain nuclease of toxin-antitoxin system
VVRLRLLLDSHALVWANADPAELTSTSREAIEDPANDVLVSSASMWELAIKVAMGKLVVDVPLRDLVGEYEELPITHAHAIAAAALPEHHRDPFDRMLVAQALAEGLTIVTRDRNIPRYGVPALAA